MVAVPVGVNGLYVSEYWPPAPPSVRVRTVLEPTIITLPTTSRAVIVRAEVGAPARVVVLMGEKTS